jgi:hypothetical protein
VYGAGKWSSRRITGHWGSVDTVGKDVLILKENRRSKRSEYEGKPKGRLGIDVRKSFGDLTKVVVENLMI